MRLLITGGCGFIGSNFVRFVLEHYQPEFVTNADVLSYAGNPENLAGVAEEHADRYEFFRSDIADRDAIEQILARHKFYAIVNFAAESHVDRSITDPANFIHTNVIGTEVLLEAARKHGVKRFIQVSTDEVYGSLGPTGKFTESSPLDPSSPYSASKASADLLALAAFKTFDQEVLITRCSNNYGPYQFPEKLIPLMITNALADKKLPVYGDGLNVRDWIHVEDHCRGIMAVLLEGRPGGGLQPWRRRRDGEHRRGRVDPGDARQAARVDQLRDRPAGARQTLRNRFKQDPVRAKLEAAA